MPAAVELPPDLQKLAELNAFEVRHDSWMRDVRVLFKGFQNAWRRARPLRGWPEFFSGAKSAVLLSLIVLGTADVLRMAAPLYLVVESTLGVLVGLMATLTVFVVWSGGHPGARRVRDASVVAFVPFVLLLAPLWIGYRFFAPVALTAEQGPPGTADCTSYFVQPYRGSLPRWQPTQFDANQTPCVNAFGGPYQQVTVRQGLTQWVGSLAISSEDDRGQIEAVLVPWENEQSVETVIDGKPEDLPASRPEIKLALGRMSVPFLSWFRVESSYESVRTVVTLWSPLGLWKAGEETLDVTTELRSARRTDPAR